MKALLVYPKFPNTYWSFRHALSFEGKRSAFPPLSLLTVSALLPSVWERRLIDMNVRRLRLDDIRWADVVLISGMLVQKESLLRVIDLCNAAGKRVMVGGPYVSSSIEGLARADHIIIGEAETLLPKLTNDLERHEAARIYEAAERPPLTVSPAPDFRLAELKRYSAMSVQYSRGCPFQCEFCDIIEIYGRVPRCKSSEQMLAELDALRRCGWRGTVFIVDDNFIGNKRNVKQLLPALAEWQERNHFPFTFLTEASLNLAEEDELLDGMRRAGFRRVFIGIETPVEESLREARKPQNLRGDLLDAVRKIQSYGMEVMGGFIVGFDHDPEDIFRRQIEFIKESAIPVAMVGLLNALPNTQLWRRLKSEDRLTGESAGNNTDCSLNFVPRMDATALIEGYQSILRAIYNSREYYQRALDCLSRVSDEGPKPRSHHLIRDIAALAQITLKLGVRDGERGEFWHYINRALFQHREKFAEAVRLAAIGYHFRKLTESYCQ